MGVCAICFKDVLIEDLFECEKCGKKVCSDHIIGQKIAEDDFINICVNCNEKN